MATAQLVARLRHPSLVRMLPLPGGAGLAPVLIGSRRLAEVSSRSAPFRRFPVEQAVRLLLDVLSGLGVLHGVVVGGRLFVHGAVSPQHIYIGEQGGARLVPLVSTHMMPSSGPEPTGYVAPELLLGDVADERADLFSVGVMLWEILAGRRMFADPSAEGVIALLVGGKLPRLNPPARAPWARLLCAVAERATAVDPASRYANAAELASAIAEAGGEHLTESANHNWQDEAPTLQRPPLRALTPGPIVVDIPAGPTAAAAAASVPPLTSAATLAPVSESRSRGRGWLVALAALPAVAAGWLLLAPHAPPHAPASAATLGAPLTAAALAPPPAPAPASAPPLPSASAAATSSAPAAAKATPPKPALRRRAPKPIADYGI